MGRVGNWTSNRRIALPLAGGAVVLGLGGGLYVTGLVTGGDIDRGTSVLGVDIGGMSRGRRSRR